MTGILRQLLGKCRCRISIAEAGDLRIATAIDEGITTAMASGLLIEMGYAYEQGKKIAVFP